MPEIDAPTEYQVGRDKVLVYDTRIVILAARAMDWPIREFSRPPIYFKDCKFYLRGKSAADAPYAMRYELWVWPEGVHDQSPHSIYYDEEYVRQRDVDSRTESMREFSRVVLLTFYPLLGFFWSSFKERHFTPCGINAISVTRVSVTVEFLFWLMEAIFAGWLHSGLLTMFTLRVQMIPVDWCLLFLLGADCLLRCNQLLGGDAQYPWGFLEWTFPKRKKQDA